MNLLFLLLAGFAGGIISGMGMGGGTILIPILTLLAGLSQHEAQGINMLAFLPGALLALLVHKKDGRLEAKSALPLILFGSLGAIGGALLATFLEALWLRKAFGIFLIALAVFQWFNAKNQA